MAKSKSLREKVYDIYRERIGTGQITHDDRMVDMEIAAELGISRMPVREALMQLVHEGMLESSSRGFVLRRFSDFEIEEIFEIRNLLEPVAASRAASNMTDAVLQQLEGVLKKCRRASETGEIAKFIVTNAEFRNTWLRQVTNSQLVAAITTYVDHVQAVRLATLQRVAVRNDVLELMQALLEAFRTRNAAKAAAVIERALGNALDAFRHEREHSSTARKVS
ncbi:GntR family transcriptional regulator [Bradyrhizobium jicamae]|uniref:GntR family transcriptional regulator n=1 Tax=Bradyrhizobium jicamae TaxID=280332 RepID=UPI001BA95B3C|nr:GntR family transcriptional regulator [Bradyrhizobium jicamae]MBR0751279.1 GntR family transcriptional regulator [Bradyrhizobium jicamae]